MWFTEQYGANITSLTGGGKFVDHSVRRPDSEPERITLGPDRRLWFTEYSGNRIGAMTSAGVLTEFTLPPAGADTSSTRKGLKRWQGRCRY